ncbi:leucyl/phenylalanyl-tRNA--protein transferase [Caldimonas sp. KR1-144]|uniref:leucyl/phenylalanyl-tRNA--protein transferase n=1 Tax=Caldimonas sp. KR1-144 TaxID=3400911 RepID=UPI003C05A7BC
MIAWLHDELTPLPPTARALGPDSDAPGLLAAGGSLSVARLTEAYSHGVFPWYGDGQPVLWWSPDPRMVLRCADLRISHSLRKRLRRFRADAHCEIRIDSAFDRVIEACASVPRDGQPGTWIVGPMRAAYRAWHRAGAVHSFETWIDGKLAGGLYGVNLGRMFFGESMFARETDASKIALAALVAFCRAHGIEAIDCQQNTAHLASLGAREWPRRAFEAHLARCVHEQAPKDWSYHPSLWAQLGLDGPAAPPTPAEP